MDDNVFLFWNKSGIIFFILYILYFQISFYIRNKQFHQFKLPIDLFGIFCIIMIFILSGWVAGLSSTPAGLIIGIIIAKIILPK